MTMRRWVRELLRDRHPDLADRPLRLGARGWSNQLWRLGDDPAVRLPWVGESVDALLLKEHAWLPGELADRAAGRQRRHLVDSPG